MKIRLGILVIIASVAVTSSAFAAAPGWYLGLGAGYSTLNTLNTTASGSGNFPSSSAVTGEIAAGYGWTNGLRIENEVAYSSHGVNPDNGVTATGSVAVRSDFVNLLYDARLNPRVHITIGAGAGYGLEQEDATITDAGASPVTIRGGGGGLAYQGIFGVSYMVTRHIDLYADYHYRGYQTAHNDNGSLTVGIGEAAENAFMVGLRWYPRNR